jgi:fructose-1,6-bisphosphatase
MTLTRFILSEQQKFANASGDLTIILAAIATACKAISSACRRGALIGLYGLEGGTNSTGDSVKKLGEMSHAGRSETVGSSFVSLHS